MVNSFQGMRVRIVKKGFLLYAAYVRIGRVWHLTGTAFTKRGARKTVGGYLNPQDRIVDEYTVTYDRVMSY